MFRVEVQILGKREQASRGGGYAQR